MLNATVLHVCFATTCIYYVYFTTAIDQATVETPISNPGYVELSPCPCDTTAAKCDTDCCCDKVDRKNFPFSHSNYNFTADCKHAPYLGV